ncbi:MAG: matrixin family metalloprotease [Syntrophales bacterium]
MISAIGHPGIPGSSGKSSLRVYFLLITLIAVVIVYYRMPRPCQEPLTYHIGTVDAKFGLSRQEFADAAGRAAAVWGKQYARALFREESNGKIEVNLVYDYRQEAADKLKKLHYAIGTTKSTYDDMKVRFENLKAEYESKSAVFASDSKAYNRRIGAYNAEIEAGRQRGAVTEAVYRRLTAETGELNNMRGNLQVRQEGLRQIADILNSMTVVINDIAANYNLDVVKSQDTGKRLGSEFCGGDYVSKDGKQAITIYQFDDGNRLVRVLAHEFGHALGLKHNDNPKAIMYRLMQSDSLNLAPDDIAALKERCSN